MFRLDAWGATDVGMKRRLNEDVFLVDLEAGVFLVADGMGGHAAGEVASRLAADEIISTAKAPCSVPHSFTSFRAVSAASAVNRSCLVTATAKGKSARRLPCSRNSRRRTSKARRGFSYEGSTSKSRARVRST